MTTHRLVLDEGGVRHTLGSERRYFDFQEIADVELRTRLLRDPILVLVDTEEEQHVVFAGPDALEIHKVLTEHAILAAAAQRSPPQHWPRHGRPLEEWLESVSASDTYRTSGDVARRALGVLADVNAAVEDRAAAAHLLVRFAEGEDLVAAAKLFASHALPPLVVAAAQLADGGLSLTTDDGFLFLSSADRKSVDLHRRAGTTRHEEAAAEARRASKLETVARPMPVHERRTAASHGPAAYRDMSRWIGKSWGI